MSTRLVLRGTDDAIDHKRSTVTTAVAKSYGHANGLVGLYPFPMRSPMLDATRRRRAPSTLQLGAAYQARVPRTHRKHRLPVHPLDVGPDGCQCVCCIGAGQLWLAPKSDTVDLVRFRGHTYAASCTEETLVSATLYNMLHVDVAVEAIAKSRQSSRASVSTASSSGTPDDSADGCWNRASRGSSSMNSSDGPASPSSPLCEQLCDEYEWKRDGKVAPAYGSRPLPALPSPPVCRKYKPLSHFASVDRAGAAFRSAEESIGPSKEKRGCAVPMLTASSSLESMSESASTDMATSDGTSDHHVCRASICAKRLGLRRLHPQLHLDDVVAVADTECSLAQGEA